VRVPAAAAAGRRHLYISNCAVGISALLFALKVVLNHDAPSHSSIMGFSLPTKVGDHNTTLQPCLTGPGPSACILAFLPGLWRDAACKACSCVIP
jgi:rhomboid domain-containing protein 1